MLEFNAYASHFWTHVHTYGIEYNTYNLLLSIVLIEGIDWYRDADTGAFVWTAKYLSGRGFCCNGKCRHCPYDVNGDLKQLAEPTNIQLIKKL